MAVCDDHSDDSIILSYFDSLLKESDLRILNNSGWLNDRLIGFVFEYFERKLFSERSNEIAFIQPLVSQFIKLYEGLELNCMLDSLDLTNKKLIFLPINDLCSRSEAGGSHWTLLVYIHSCNCFVHFDSLSNSGNLNSAKKTAERLQQFLQVASKPAFKEIANGPKQLNGYDCGVYVICEVEVICKGLFLDERSITPVFNSCTEICNCLTAAAVQRKRTELSSLIIHLKTTQYSTCSE